MSKTVKTIALLGLALPAMLGTKAEAHSVYTNGRWVYHSVGCIAELESVSNPATVPSSVECVVNTALVETLCQDPSGLVYPVTLPIQVTLVSKAPIAPGDVTGPGLAQVEVIVPDAPLLNVNLNPACVNSTPIAVLIRNMASKISVFRCVGAVVDPCLVRLVTSIAAAQCELPAQFNLDNYPENLPPDGTPFTCTDPVSVHVN
ncbi:MAG: hypothetical protein ACREBC_31240 [Pyrinomonadaceae bacterium]